MWEFVILVSIQILFSVYKCESMRLHTEFGEYNDRIPKDLWTSECGLRRVREKQNIFGSNECFKEKKPFRELMSVIENQENSSEFNTRILNGQMAVEGEAPWAVRIAFKDYGCGGVVLNKKWIMTAAHCIEDHKGTINVGSIYYRNLSKYSMFEMFKHKKFNQSKASTYCEADIALIKTVKDIEFTTNGSKYVVNTICLPKMDLKNSREEWATLYGWGRDSEDLEKYLDEKVLIKGEFLLKVSKECNNGCYCSKPPSNTSAMVCRGDSGSGLVQWIGPQDRAVVIGITTNGEKSPKHKHCGDKIARFVSVSQQINWILDIIKNN